MQQLQYEHSWDKALSPKDRQQIEQIFDETKDQNTEAIMCVPIRVAINHQQALLITVLIHNFTAVPLSFIHQQIVYETPQQVLAEKTFTLPALVISPKTSMPWTFIFPKGHYLMPFDIENDKILQNSHVYLRVKK